MLINDELNELKEVMGRRSDLYWELLATSVGAAEAVEKTLKGLSAREIHKGSQGLMIAPSYAMERIEALVAWNPQALVSLASEWLAPKYVDSMSWWVPVWHASLRHLKALQVIQRADVDFPVLSMEVKVLWPDAEKRILSWQEIKNSLAKSRTYEKEKILANCQLCDETISLEQLRDAPEEMLRLLKGQAHLLDVEAREYLGDSVLATIVEPGLTAEWAVELCKELSLDVMDEICRTLIFQIPTLEDPQKIIPLVYILVSDWQMP